MTLILNCKALHPERMNSAQALVQRETGVKLRTSAVRKLDPSISANELV